MLARARVHVHLPRGISYQVNITRGTASMAGDINLVTCSWKL